MNTCRVFLFLVILWVVSFAVSSRVLEAKEADISKPSLANWLESVLGKDSSYISNAKEVNMENLILIANTLCEKEEYQKAIDIYQKALEEFNSADAAYNMGITYEINLKNPSLALLYYTKFLSLESDSPDAEAVRTWMQRIKKRKTSEPIKQEEKTFAEPPLVFEASEEKKPPKRDLRTGPPIHEVDIPANQMKVAKSFLRTGNEHYIKARYQEAIEDFMRVLDYYDSPDAYYNLGITYHQKLNNPTEAIRFYHRYLEVDSYGETANEVKELLEQVETSILMKKLKEESLKVPVE
jgi:tetratricopeptide (TPR) repeat protein